MKAKKRHIPLQEVTRSLQVKQQLGEPKTGNRMMRRTEGFGGMAHKAILQFSLSVLKTLSSSISDEAGGPQKYL